MTEPAPDVAGPAVEAIVRTSYGRLVAFLASISADLAAAEDALSEALVAALRTWPERGVPAQPESWLVTVARRHLVDTARRRAVAVRHLPELARRSEDGAAAGPDPEAAVPDKRLELMFACAHPAVDVAMRSPLMLQVVLGVDAARIASAFLVAPATMGQRLVRAKAAIKKAGVRFRMPGQDELPDRLTSVLDGIYAAYGSGWDATAGPGGAGDGAPVGLVDEALRLARLVVDVLPGEPEARGLLALLLHSHARRAARRSADGEFVPLERQDTTVWDASAMAEAEHHLSVALSARRLGPYQLQGAIQSVHNRRVVTGTTDWAAIAALYDGVVAFAPSIGAFVARAAATVEVRGPAAGLALLDELPPDRVTGYQPYWVARAEALRRSGDDAAAAAATGVAVGLTEDPAVRRHLLAAASAWQAGRKDLPSGSVRRSSGP